MDLVIVRLSQGLPGALARTAHERIGKFLGPQLLPEGQPTNEWGVDQLGVYAQMQYRQIVDEEKHATRSYWRLGNALSQAKKAFAHGHWARYLKELGIDKSRASKARVIYRTFTQEEDATGLTVDEAYARRHCQGKRKQHVGDADASERDVKGLHRSVRRIAERTGAVIHEAAFAAPGEAGILIPAVRKAIWRNC
jgi:hypothetical protein